MAYLNGGAAGVTLACDIFGAVLIIGSLAADRIAIVACADQLLPDLNALVLSALVVESVLRIACGADTVNGAGDKVCCNGLGINDRVSVSCIGKLQRSEILAVIGRPSYVCAVVSGVEMRCINVLISVRCDPTLNSGKEVCIAVVIDCGDHIKGGVSAALGLPEVVAPVIVVVTVGSLYLVDNGSLLAVCIVKPICTAGCEYENVLVFCISQGFFCEHILCFEELAVKICAAAGKIVDRIKLLCNEAHIGVGIKNRFIAVEVKDELLALFKGEDAYSYNGFSNLHSGLEYAYSGLDGFQVGGHTAAEDEHYVDVAFNRAGNGQRYVGLIEGIEGSSCFIEIIY